MSHLNHDCRFTNVTCDVCKVQGVSSVGSYHRWCGGSEGASIRDKGNKLPTANRGKWAV